jgi:hypothetical protein
MSQRAAPLKGSIQMQSAIMFLASTFSLSGLLSRALASRCTNDD